MRKLLLTIAGLATGVMVAVLLSARHELADPGRAMEGSDG